MTAQGQTSGGPAISDEEIAEALAANWIEAPVSLSRSHRVYDFLSVGKVEQFEHDGLTYAWFGRHRFGGYHDPDIARQTVQRAWARSCEILWGKPPAIATRIDGWLLPFMAGAIVCAALGSVLLAVNKIDIGGAHQRALTECYQALQSRAHGAPTD